MPRDIPLHEIAWHPWSQWDSMGRLFSWRGELYRGLTSTMAPFYRELFDAGRIEDLVQRGWLVATEPTDLHLTGFDLIIRHARVPVVSFPFEWSRDMLRAAAELCVELQQQLAIWDCAFADLSPFNILFDSTRPLLADFCCIVPAHVVPPTRWDGVTVFEAAYLAPLVMMDAGFNGPARVLLAEGINGISAREAWRRALIAEQSVSRTGAVGLEQAVACAAPRAWLSLQAGFAKASLLFGWPEASRAAYLRWVQRRLQRIDVASSTQRTEYSPFTSDEAGSTQELRAIVDEIQPATVLTTRATALALFLASPNRVCTALDVDPAKVSWCHREARGRGLNMLSLVADWTNDNATPQGVLMRSRFDLAPRLVADLVIDLPPRGTRRRRANGAALARLVGRWLLTDPCAWGIAREAEVGTAACQLEATLGIPFDRCELRGGGTKPALLLCERAPVHGL